MKKKFKYVLKDLPANVGTNNGNYATYDIYFGDYLVTKDHPVCDWTISGSDYVYDGRRYDKPSWYIIDGTLYKTEVDNFGFSVEFKFNGVEFAYEWDY